MVVESKEDLRINVLFARIECMHGNPHNVRVGSRMPDTDNEVTAIYYLSKYYGDHSENYIVFQLDNGNRQLWNASRLEVFELIEESKQRLRDLPKVKACIG